MRLVTSYICEGCGQTFTYQDEALKCEAKHLDLTIDEYKYYLQLKEDLKSACWRCGYCNNEETRKAEDEAAKKLVDFEQTYNLNFVKQRRV